MNHVPLLIEMTAFDEGSAQRIQHFIKVYELCRTIGLAEGLDARTQEILETAALVHDIGIRPSLERYGDDAGFHQEELGPDEARRMLEYGFAGYQRFTPVRAGDALGMSVPVRLGGSDSVGVVSGGTAHLLIRKGDQGGISVEAALLDEVTAPVKKGDVLGEIRIMQDGKVVKTLEAVAAHSVELPGVVHALLRIRDRFMLR